MAARRLGLPRDAGVGNRKRQQCDRRRDTTVSRCFVGLAQLLGRNLNQVGAAHAQVEPLIADRLVAADFDLVEKGPALPAGVVGNQGQNAVGILTGSNGPVR